MRVVMTATFAILASLPALAQGLSTGWEDGEPHGRGDQVIYAKDVAGFFNTMNPGPECSRRAGEIPHSGAYSLMIAGHSNAGYAYCYYRLFDDDLPIRAGQTAVTVSTEPGFVRAGLVPAISFRKPSHRSRSGFMLSGLRGSVRNARAVGTRVAPCRRGEGRRNGV